MHKYGDIRHSGAILTGLAIIMLLINLPACTDTGLPKAENAGDSPFPIDRIVTVRIVMPGEDWQAIQKNASQERYFKADLWYGAEQLPGVAVRTKGLNSLQGAIQAGSIRFGLKVDINFFNSARNLYGIKKLSFNNGYNDPTFIREMLGYELYKQMGVPTPRYAFTDLWVNDTHLGLYMMAEQVDKVFIERNFSNTTGNLYKPEGQASYLNWTLADLPSENATAISTADEQKAIASINLGGGNLQAIINALEPAGAVTSDNISSSFPGGMQAQGAPGMPPPGGPPPGWMPHSDNRTQGFNGPPPGAMPISDNRTQATGDQADQMQFLARGMPPGGQPGMPPGGRQGNLLELMGLKTNENKADHTSLFRLLDILNNEPDTTFPAEIEKVLDVDEVLRFLAVSTAIVHLDNYTGMGHNYYLYDIGGRFVIIPWDLNLSFGTYSGGVASDNIVNFLIDEPTAGPVSDRPLVARLLAYEPYLERYHSYLQEIINGPFSTASMNTRIDELAAFIRPYVEKDELKFYSMENFEKSLKSGITPGNQSGGGMMSPPGLKDFIAGRNASIAKQLSGEQPAKSSDGSGNKGSEMPGGAPPIQGMQNAPGGNQ